MVKKRLDAYLHESGLFPSREKAKSAIMAGAVLVEGRRITKPGTKVTEGQKIEVQKEKNNYVSRGGIKLEHALKVFGVDARGRNVIDVGSSTGGFTECVLRKGAERVIAVDVGKGVLHWKLRTDPRVHVLEGKNARYLKRSDLPFIPDLAAIDVSFISLKKIIPAVLRVLEEPGEIIALVKPQFEAGRKEVGKGGVVRDPVVHASVLESFLKWCVEQRIHLTALTYSAVRGLHGNIEFFVHLNGCQASWVSEAEIQRIIKEAHEYFVGQNPPVISGNKMPCSEL